MNLTEVMNSSTVLKTPFLIELANGYLGFSIAATVFFNGLMVYVYFKHSSLRTSFNAYITNLCITEILNACTGMAGSFLRILYGRWPLNYGSCIVFNYCADVFGSALRYCHILVAMNRLWAVTFPTHFKRYSHMPQSMCAIGASWIFVNVVHLPVLIPSFIWPIPGDTQCLKNTNFQKNAAVFVEVMGFAATEVAMILISAITAYKVFSKRRMVRSTGNACSKGMRQRTVRITTTPRPALSSTASCSTANFALTNVLPCKRSQRADTLCRAPAHRRSRSIVRSVSDNLERVWAGAAGQLNKPRLCAASWRQFLCSFELCTVEFQICFGARTGNFRKLPLLRKNR